MSYSNGLKVTKAAIQHAGELKQIRRSIWLLIALFSIVAILASGPTIRAQVSIPTSINSIKTTATALTPAHEDVLTWEPSALRDLANILNWPVDVTRDSAGRLIIQHVVTGVEWSRANIRSLGFRAAAVAAFTAEQDDARLAGYSISLATFEGYPAYWATISDGRGEVVERRLHWQADAWVLGVDIRMLAPEEANVRTVGERLLTLALQYGLPGPQSGGDATPTPPRQPSPTPTPCGIAFSDVPAGSWAYNYISELACRGVISGYSDGTFRPQSPTTRGQIVKMVVSAQGWRLLRPRVPTFTDTNEGNTFYPYIETAVAHGIINGYSDKTFRSSVSVTRAQVAKIVALAQDWPLTEGAQTELCDVPQAHWASLYVQAAISRGIFTGYGDGCFYPDDYATRAQLAKVLVLAGR